MLSTFGNNAVAQVPGPPEVSVMDEAGINILTGLPSFQQTDLEIGSGLSKLTHTISSYDAGYFWGFQDNLTGSAGTQTGTVDRYGSLPGASPQRFRPNGSGGFMPTNQNGATLLQQANGSWLYTAADGTRVLSQGDIRKTTFPNGYEITTYFGDPTVNPNTGLTTKRKVSHTTNTGLQLAYKYEGNTHANSKFYLPSSSVALNNAFEYCSPTSSLCQVNQIWPTSTYTWPEQNVMFAKHSEGATTATGEFVVIDAKGNATHYVHKRFSKNADNNLGMHFPPSLDPEGNPVYVTRLTEIYNGAISGEPIKKYSYQNFVQRFPVPGGGPGSEGGWRYELKHQLVKESSVGDAKWTYNHNQPDTQYRSTGESNGPRERITAVMALGGSVSRYLSVTTPSTGVYYEDNEANRVDSAYENGYEYIYEYDTRGNVTKRTQVGKDGEADLILTAGYDTTCSNLKTCNKPNWTRDAKGNQTDYEYHAQSGQLSKVTSPADHNGVRPQTRYTYSQKYAWFLNASGSYVKAATPIWLLTREAYCRSSSATETGCSLAGDEVVTTYDYGPNAGPNNLFLRGITVSADGQSQTTCYDYDRFGNQIAETKPRANVASCY